MWSAFSVSRRPVGTVSVTEDVCVVEVQGELDVVTVAAFRTCVSAALESSRAVVVDLSATTLLDCAGLSALLGAQREARQVGGALAVAEVHGLVRLVFDAFGVDETLGGGDLDVEVLGVARFRSHPERCLVPSRLKARAS